jgi:hypothetical protein
MLLVCLGLTGCAGGILSISPVPPDISIPTPMPNEMPDENHTDTPSTISDISQIPNFGNRENFRLPAEHALAYVKAIRDAVLFVGDCWNFSFDTFYPVFLDISGDGVPLLLLAQEEIETGDHWGVPTYSTLLFGYADGELQIITEFMGIGIWSTENENLLSVFWETDFGSTFSLYRVYNGSAELVSNENYTSDWHGGLISINGIAVSEEEFFAAYAEIPLERLMERGHPGCIIAGLSFEEYLSELFTREQAIQILLDYVDTFGGVTKLDYITPL